MTDRLAIKGGTKVRERPFHGWPVFGDEERRALLEVLDSGKWAFGGPQEAAFAEAFGRFSGAKHTFCVANGSVSLEMALRVLDVGPGDEVIVPALTWPATALAALEVGAVPRFADVRRQDWCLDPASVRQLVGPRTKAVIPVHLYSQVAEIDELLRIAQERGFAVVEDCAHAHGARIRDRGVGTFGAIGSFSFQHSKAMTAGEGGAVTTEDDELAHRLYGAKNCGRPWTPDGPTTFGGNNRITEFQAAVLSAQLGRLEAQLATKAERIDRFRRRMAEVDGIEILPFKPEVTRVGLYGLSLRLDAERFAGLPRAVVLSALQAEGIPVNQPYDVVYRSPLWVSGKTYRRFDPSARADQVLDLHASCPVAEDLARASGIVIPHEVFLGPAEDMDDLAAGFAKVRRLASSLTGDALKSKAKDLIRRVIR